MLYHRCTDVTVSNIRCQTILKSNFVPAYILFSIQSLSKYLSRKSNVSWVRGKTELTKSVEKFYCTACTVLLKTSRSYCSVRTLKIQVIYCLLSRKKSSNGEAGSIRRFNLKKILQYSSRNNGIKIFVYFLKYTVDSTRP